jgi:hypothetical protein
VDADLWAILRWLLAAVDERDGRWNVEGLQTTGRIYRVSAAEAARAQPGHEQKNERKT